MREPRPAPSPQAVIAEQRGRIAEINRMLRTDIGDQAAAGLRESRGDAEKIIADTEEAMRR